MSGTVVVGLSRDCDLADLDRQVTALARLGALVLLDVGAVTAPDITTVHILLRLTLRARRHGARLRLLRPGRLLRKLISLVGAAVELPEQVEHPL